MNQSANGALKAGRRSIDDDLQVFNQLVLQNQDEAFTLACDLLGDENLACKIMEEVFRQAFGKYRAPQSGFRLEILQRITVCCVKKAKVLAGPKTLERFLVGLSNDEKVVLVLVDCLELSYADAGWVLGKQPDAVRKMLAKARFAAKGCIEIGSS
ncbi:MAG TPA: hypothetical protein VF355_05425 [Anaerolineaceae bacterium]